MIGLIFVMGCGKMIQTNFPRNFVLPHFSCCWWHECCLIFHHMWLLFFNSNTWPHILWSIKKFRTVHFRIVWWVKIYNWIGLSPYTYISVLELFWPWHKFFLLDLTFLIVILSFTWTYSNSLKRKILRKSVRNHLSLGL